MTPSIVKRAKALSDVPFVRSVLKFQIGTGIMIIAGFASSILYARLLGVEQYGLYAVVSAFTGLITIVARFGQETTLTTFLAEAFGRKDKNDIAMVLRYFIQSTAYSLIIYIALILCSPLLGQILQGNAQIGMLGRILIFNTMLQSAPVLAFLALQMNRQVGLVTILESTRVILQVALNTVLLMMGYGIEGILIGTTAISLLYVPVSLWFYTRVAKELQFPTLGSIFGTALQKGTGPHFRQGFWIALDQNIWKNFYPNLFYLALNATSSLETVGLFRLALNLSDVPGNFVMPAITRTSSVTIPRIVGQNRSALKSSCIKLIKGSIALNGLAVLGAAICIPVFLPMVYGQQYTPAIPIFLILVPTNILAGLNVVSIPLARVFRKVWAMVTVNITGVFVALGLYWVLHYFLSPLIAMGIAINYFFLHSLLLYVYLWHVVNKGSGLQKV